MGNLHLPVQQGDFFLPLDNSAVFMASVTGKKTPFVFRVSCELDGTVHLPDLAAAFDEAARRFPFLGTELRPGLFWYYLEPLKKPFRLQADSRFPVEYHRIGRWGNHLFRVRVYGSRVACEFHHILTDGTGAMEFLRTLVACYLTRRGVHCADWETVKRPDEPVDPREYEDAYAALVRKGIPEPDPLPAAFKLPGRRYRHGPYRVTTGSMPVAAALRAARERGVSLTELLAAVHLWSLQAVAEETAAERRHLPYGNRELDARRIRSRAGDRAGGMLPSDRPSADGPACVQIPVNMRKFYPSPTMRNFFLFVPVSIDLRLGHYEFSAILERVRHQMKLGLDRKELDRQIVRNVGSEQKLVARVIPLVAKNVGLKIIGAYAADLPYSGSLSNIQSVSMPQAFAGHIRRFDFVPSRNTTTGANVGVVSWKDTLAVSVGSMVVERSFERHFFSTCASLDIPVTVESNIK